MNTTINPGGPTVPQPASANTRPAASGDADGGASGVAPAAGGPKAADHVKLTESALAIGAASKAADAPVDTQRVDRIRQAIADGSYKVDAQKIADKLIALDKQIG